jgi:hypothetical protein
MTKPYDITQALVRIKLGVPDLFNKWHPIYVDRFEGLRISTLAELNSFITYTPQPLQEGDPAPTKTLKEISDAHFNIAYFEVDPKVTPAKYDYGLVVRDSDDVTFKLFVVRGNNGTSDFITDANLETALEDISVGEIDAGDLVQLTWSNSADKWQYVISSGTPGVPDADGFVPSPIPNIRNIVFVTEHNALIRDDLATLLGLDDDYYYYHARMESEQVMTADGQKLYVNRPIPVLRAVAEMYHWFNDINDGDLVSLITEMRSIQSSVNMFSAANSEGIVWNSLYQNMTYPTRSTTAGFSQTTDFDWQIGEAFRLNLCSLLGIQNPNYFYQVRGRPEDRSLQEGTVPANQGSVYSGKPLRVMDAVAVLYRFMNNLESNTRLNLKEWLVREDHFLRVDLGQEDRIELDETTGEATFAKHYFDVTDFDGERAWSNKIYKFVGIINNDWVELHRNPYIESTKQTAYTIAKALTDLRQRIDHIGLELSQGAPAGQFTPWHATFRLVDHFTITNDQYDKQVILSKVLGIDNADYVKYCRERVDEEGDPAYEYIYTSNGEVVQTATKPPFGVAYELVPAGRVMSFADVLVDLKRRMDDLFDGDVLDLKGEITRVRDQLGIDSGDNNPSQYLNGTVINNGLKFAFGNDYGTS